MGRPGDVRDALRLAAEKFKSMDDRLTDMEGPSVKWFLTASPISWSMLTFEHGPR
jgi:hypothetical protein